MAIKKHYSLFWGEGIECIEKKELVHKLLPSFNVLKYRPDKNRNSWIYATCGMSENDEENGLELFILAPTENDFMIKLLSAIAYYHASGNKLDLGHTVNFGMGWYKDSECDHGLISLPYLYGPDLEWLKEEKMNIRFLWLVPITADELDYKKANGVDALEDLFEEKEFNYIDPFRDSVINS